MDNGMNSIQNDGVLLKEKAKKRKGCLLWLLVIGIAYVLLTLWAQWTPSVRGIVVDAETGKPIEGVEIIRQGQGGTIFPTEKVGAFVSDANDAKTDCNGFFKIRGTVRERSGLIVLAPAAWIDEIILCANYPDYICSKSPYARTLPGDVSGRRAYIETHEGWEKSKPSYGKGYYERRRCWLFGGYEFIVHLVKARSEEDWRKKCECVLGINEGCVKIDLTEKWLFDDIVGYLERFPEGEKAGEYLCKAISSSLVRHERKKKLTKADKTKFVNEASILLHLSEKVKSPKAPWSLSVEYDMRLKELKKELLKMNINGRENDE